VAQAFVSLQAAGGHLTAPGAPLQRRRQAKLHRIGALRGDGADLYRRNDVDFRPCGFPIFADVFEAQRRCQREGDRLLLGIRQVHFQRAFGAERSGRTHAHGVEREVGYLYDELPRDIVPGPTTSSSNNL
jgi:hypothetical protein